MADISNVTAAFTRVKNAIVGLLAGIDILPDNGLVFGKGLAATPFDFYSSEKLHVTADVEFAFDSTEGATFTTAEQTHLRLDTMEMHVWQPGTSDWAVAAYDPATSNVKPTTLWYSPTTGRAYYADAALTVTEIEMGG